MRTKMRRRTTNATTRCAPRRLVVSTLAAIVVTVVAMITGAVGAGPARAALARGNSVEVARKVTVDGTPLPAYPGSGTDRAVGLAAPVLTSVDFEGADAEVGGATGAPYGVVFLAHWCPHCQAEVPVIVSLKK